MAGRIGRFLEHVFGVVALAAMAGMPVSTARADEALDIERAFDNALGTELRGPRTYETPFEARIAALANAANGRIGVAAMDLSTGRTINVLGDQRFPMASTSKIAIAATFLEGVDKNRWSLTSEFPMMIPVKSVPRSSAVAPVRPGEYKPAYELIELMLTRSNNSATDALLAAVGGPAAVNDWVKRAGIREWRIDRDIATLVRDDGAIDPAAEIDLRDSATPLAMVQLLAGLHEGRWLSESSRNVLLGAMGRCVTGKRRIPANLPDDASVAHKTGSLFNTSSDVGIVRTSDGRAMAVAIYVTGQGSRLNREARIAELARAIYDGYLLEPQAYPRTAAR